MLKNSVLLILSVVVFIVGSTAFSAPAKSKSTKSSSLGKVTLYCRIDPAGRPITYLEYYGKAKVAFVMSGWPAKWTKYTDVIETTGLPPFGKKGKSLVGFGGDVPMIHYKRTGNATTWYEQQSTRYPFFAVWGSLPGAKAKAEGVCWTPTEQPFSINY